SGPPPAPVPTMTKSTASSSLNWRIGTQPPRLKTSGARPSAARGRAKGSDDMGVLPSRTGFLLAGGCLDGFPGVAPVQSHPHITTGTRRTPEADLVPSGWMRVVRVSYVGNDSVLEKQLGRHVAPRFTGEITVLHALQQPILLLAGQRVERAPVGFLGCRLERGQPAPPRLALRRYLGITIPIQPPIGDLLIDIGWQRNGRTILWLRQDPIA